MAKHAIAILVLSLFPLTGCYVDSLQDRELQSPKGDEECKRGLGEGCIVGVLQLPSLVVEGRYYGQVEKIADDFSALVDMERLVQEEKLELSADRDYEVVVADSEFRTRTFAQGFMAYLTGERAKTARLNASGEFFFDSVVPGTYSLRVQRSINLQVRSLPVDAPVVDGQNEEDAEAEEPEVIEDEVHHLSLIHI